MTPLAIDLEMANFAEAERRYGDAGMAEDFERWRKEVAALIAERDALQEQRRALLDEVARLRRVEELYNAGLETWEPAYKIVLDERDALRDALEEIASKSDVDLDEAPQIARAALERKP